MDTAVPARFLPYETHVAPSASPTGDWRRAITGPRGAGTYADVPVATPEQAGPGPSGSRRSGGTAPGG